MPIGLGILFVVLGLAAVVFGVAFAKMPEMCGPGESHVVCVRQWLSAAGPIFAAFALVVAAWQLFWAQQTQTRQLRAYIGATPIIRGDAPTSISVLVDNQGQTPAYKVRTWINWQERPVGSVNLPDTFKFPDYGDTDLSSTVNLQSRGSKEITTFGFGPAFQRLRNNEASLFVYGHVDYEDTFGIAHSTTFAYHYTLHQDAEQRTTHQLRMLNVHNDAD